MRRLILSMTLLLLMGLTASAQFRNLGGNLAGGPPGSDATGHDVNPDSDVPADSVGGFSFKHMYRGLTRQEPLKYSYGLLASAMVPGSMQAYNKDYYKIPIAYGGIGAGIYGGIHFNNLYKSTLDPKYRQYSTLSYAGAALVYWGQMLDGIVCLPAKRNPDPDKSMLYSALLPGLGQAYNGDWWHIPIWYGGLTVCGYCYHTNNIQYKRFKHLYQLASDPQSGFTGKITSEQALWYRNQYRRYRDYSILATIIVYALNIIDANVFAYMSDFNVNDDLTVSMEPALISPAGQNLAYAPSALGLQMNINF